MQRLRKIIVMAVMAGAFAGCGEADDAKTVFNVRIEAGDAPMAEVPRIELDIDRMGTQFLVPLTNADGSSLTLPLMREVRLPDDQRGEVLVVARALDGSGNEIARGSQRAEIIPGETITMVLVFGLDEPAPVARLVATPTSIDFGTLTVGETSAITDIVVQNTGGTRSGDLDISFTGAELAFGPAQQPRSTCDTGLAPGQTCVIGMIFAPTVAGAAAAEVTIAGDPGGSAKVALSGVALSPGALELAPETHDFGALQQGVVGAAATFTVHNAGGSPTGVPAATLSGDHAADFAVTGNDCAALPAGGSCSFTVVMTPSATGARSAVLTVNATPGGMRTAMLSGTGLAPAALAMTPAVQDYGTIVVGNQSDATFTVRNPGGVPSGMLATTAPTGEFSLVSDGCAGMVLAPAGSCTITVRLRATSAGAKSGALTVAATPGGSARSTLAASAITPGALSITPASNAFPGQLMGSTGAPFTFTVRNTGQAATGVPAVSLGGSAAAQFTITANSCTAVLAGNATCTVGVAFRPTVRGGQTASLGVTASPGGTAAASLSGTGLMQATLVGSTTTFNFGTVDVTRSSAAQTLTVRNSGDVASSALTLASTGNPGDFGVSNVSCTGTLAAGASCTVRIVFSPTVGGARSLTTTVSASTGGSARVVSSGTGRALSVLTVTPAGSGTGTVTSVPTGISCGADCSEGYVFGTSVTLTAAASPSARFGGWTGACTGMTTCTVTMSAARAVTATFIRRYTLSATAPSGGSINGSGLGCGTTCSAAVDSGAAVAVTAQAGTGFTFSRWTSAACAGQGATCTFTMSADTGPLAAAFTRNRYTISLTTSGNAQYTVTGGSTPGGFWCPGGDPNDCSETYDYGTTVTLTMNPQFAAQTTIAWTGCSRVPTPTTCEVFVDATKTINADFTLPMYGLGLTVNGNGGGSVTSPLTGGVDCPGDCAEPIMHGTWVRLEAFPNAVSTVTWGGCDSANGNNCYIYSMDRGRSITATFSTGPIHVNITSTYGGNGRVTSSPGGVCCGSGCVVQRCDANFLPGTNVVLTQTATAGFFASWDYCTSQSGGNCNVTTGTFTRTINANFSNLF